MADHPRSFALGAVSQLDLDVSNALATIREWKNSFALMTFKVHKKSFHSHDATISHEAHTLVRNL